MYLPFLSGVFHFEILFETKIFFFLGANVGANSYAAFSIASTFAVATFRTPSSRRRHMATGVKMAWCQNG